MPPSRSETGRSSAMPAKGNFPVRKMENGAVLVVGLIFMTLTMLIAMSLMRGATLEERMASNARNRQLALEAAEAVVRDAEENLFPGAPFSPFDVTRFVAGCTNGYCAAPAASSTTQRWQTHAWSNTAITRSFASADFSLSGLGAQPRYIVEFMGASGGQQGAICPILLYRITARGLGKDGSEAIVETYFRHRPAKFLDGSCG